MMSTRAIHLFRSFLHSRTYLVERKDHKNLRRIFSKVVHKLIVTLQGQSHALVSAKEKVLEVWRKLRTICPTVRSWTPSVSFSKLRNALKNDSSKAIPASSFTIIVYGSSSVPTLSAENIADEHFSFWEHFPNRNVHYSTDSTTEYLTVSNNPPICRLFSKEKQC